MVSVRVRLPFVCSDDASMRRMRRLGTRQSRRPENRMRTPRSSSSSQRRTRIDSLKPTRYRTSSMGRRQFSVEKA
jgi:hypothetical protein